MKRLMWFAQEVLHDLENWCDTSTSRDRKTIAVRFEHEGVEFLTLTLPAYGKALERGLAEGQFPPNLSSFHYKGALPVFLGGLLELVFDRSTGKLLQDSSVTAIWALRQFTLMFAKIVPPDDAKQRRRQASAIDKYLECEQDVIETVETIDHSHFDQFARIGSLLWARVFTDVDRKVRSVPSGIIPRHGPGATADRLTGNRKWDQHEWTERLDIVFPHQEHLISSWRSIPDLPKMHILEPGAERPVRVISVPKTYKTPRIIAIEPASMQYMQQGLLAAFLDAIEKDDSSRRLVGWASPVFNHRLAWKGSRYESHATLDLSEASDRVSDQHVRILLRNHESLAAAVDACRSRNADVPGHGVIPLAKFASMGSALTFPLESMVFMTVIFCGIENALSRPVTRRDIQSFLGQVRVYGDDIIVPVDYVVPVVEALNLHGFKVNSDKSFWTGKFRESCGMEFFDGEDVTIVRVRQRFPSDRRNGKELLAAIALRNLLYLAGLWRATAFMDQLLHGIKIPMPRVEPTSPVKGRLSFLGYEVQAVDPDTQSPLVKGVMVRTAKPVSPLDGAGALLKVLTQKQPLTMKEVQHVSFKGSACDRFTHGPHSSGKLPARDVGDGALEDRDDAFVRHPLLNGASSPWRDRSPGQFERDDRVLGPRDCSDAAHGYSENRNLIPNWQEEVPQVTPEMECICGLPLTERRLDDVFLPMLLGESPTVDVEHLHRSGRPRRVSTILRFGQPW